MFGGQSFHDFSRNTGGVNLDDILKDLFGGGFGGRSRGVLTAFLQKALAVVLEDLEVLKKKFQTAIQSFTFLSKKLLKAGNIVLIFKAKPLNLKISHGIKEGEKLRIRSKGKQSRNGARGDLIIIVKIEESPIYTREDDDLYQKVDISLKTALFGGKINIKTLKEGKEEATINITPNSKNNQKIRLKGYGVQNRKSDIYGDMYLILNVVLPNLDTLDEKIYRTLKRKITLKKGIKYGTAL